MTKTITFNETTLPITNVPYAYIVSENNIVLKLEIAETEEIGFNEVKALADNNGTIVYKEDGYVRNEFENYTCGQAGFVCNYANGVYSVELKRKSDVDVRLDTTEDNITELNETCADLYLAICEDELGI